MNPVSISGYFDILSKSQKIYSRHLEPVCRKWELTRTEVDVILFLYNNPGFDRAVDIVARRGLTKSHVSMSVSVLENRKLLTRNFCKTDRRTAHLQLTEMGREIGAEARVAQQDFFRRLYDGVEPEEIAIWEQITRKVHNNIDRLEKD